jgi:hypothetical protein
MEESAAGEFPLLSEPAPVPEKEFDLPAGDQQHVEFYSVDSDESRKTAFSTFVKRMRNLIMRGSSDFLLSK